MSLAFVQPLPKQPVSQKGLSRAADCCIPAIQSGDPQAAQWLYFIYAGQIRAYLRRHAGVAEVEDAVFSVLLEAIRTVRDMADPTVDDLSRVVRELSQQGVFALRRARWQNTPTEDEQRELVGSVLGTLDSKEREAVLRSTVLSETDAEISSHLKIPIQQIRAARAKARVQFQIAVNS